MNGLSNESGRDIFSPNLRVFLGEWKKKKPIQRERGQTRDGRKEFSFVQGEKFQFGRRVGSPPPPFIPLLGLISFFALVLFC